MPVCIRRPLLVLLVAAVAALSTAGPASAASAGARARTDPGPTARRVFGTLSGGHPSAATATGITVRASRVVAAGETRANEPVAAEVEPAAPADRAPLGLTSNQHFDALSGWQHDPADPTGALGAANVVTAVNTEVGVYDRAGVQLLSPVSLGGLTQGARGQKFDPKIVYDRYAERFVLAFLVRYPAKQRSWVFVVTIPDDATASNVSNWCLARLRGDGVARNGRQWADYPGLGYDGDSVTISTNAFTFGGGFAYAQLYHIPNAELFTSTCDASDPVSYSVFAGAATRNPSGSKAFTIQPAQTEGTTNTQFMLSYDPSGALVVWRLRETAAGPRLARSAIKVKRVQIAPYGTQKGGSYRNLDSFWDPGDLRLVNAFYDADIRRVYAAHTIFHDLTPDPVVPYAEATIKWYEVRPGRKLGSSTLTRSGLVGTPDTDAGWPVVATDGSHDLFVTYSRASRPLGEYLSAWAAEIVPGSTNALAPLLLKAGTSRLEAVPNDAERWGDFNAINRDPTAPSVVAMVNQYAKDDGKKPAGITDLWQQTVDLVSG
jgi:hypothetical protein